MADPAQTQTDVSRPSALPTAKLGNKSNVSGNSLLYMDANEYLDNFQEDLNKRVDTEIETLVDGMVDLVELASVRALEK
jgi:mediator of RNA polymerase II transcription subunit 22